MPGLRTYRSKRDAARTPEPVPEDAPLAPGAGNRFVIQEHHARALHWDLRLEHEGVLASWAVPKNLPVDPKTNHLAVHTEDHPLEYLDFEGTIPKGEYGGGTMSVWDRGTYECEKWSDREVMFVLSGGKVSGRYVLFKTGKRDRDWMVHRMDPAPDDYEPMPADISPMLATATETLPRDDKKWAYEFKWDGVRAIVYIDGGRPRAMSRNHRDITPSYPELRDLAASVGSRQLILDGELVAMDADGRPSFGALQPRMHVTERNAVRRLAAATPVTYLVFDVLYVDGHSLVQLPYHERRHVLESLALNGPTWHTPPSFTGGGAAVLAASKEQGLEGLLLKRLESTYLPGSRSKDWLKLKNVRMQEVVIAGWKPGEGNRSGMIGSLLLGVPDESGALQFAGHVGTGFTDAMLRDLAADLAPLETDAPPFDQPIPKPHSKNARWVRPELVGEVRFSEWTRDGRLRHPSWRGLRPDKSANEVRRES
ncbi:MAG: non-homologous end-joining DNA ligase [Frankiaceae bacterium]|nr:non-homologous end-joining DNA ligase [Frankiaceae bacterium]